MEQLTPLTAVTASNPYPYYATLVAEQPFYFDETLAMWVASSAKAVESVLRSDAFRVRPQSEPIPEALIDTPVGDIFGRFMRMTDGPSQAALKRAALATLDAFGNGDLPALVHRACENFGETDIDSLMFAFPPFAIAMALGFSRDDAREMAQATASLVRAIAPGATSEALALGCRAARTLYERVNANIDNDAAHAPLLTGFVREARQLQIPREALVANTIAFLFQSYDATAGLIGNTLHAIANGTSFDASDIERLVAHVSRYDSPVQNTRRFAAGDAEVLGATARAGDTILVVVAAANHDPAAERSYTFGFGGHACPGERVACTIASAAVSLALRHTDVRRLRMQRYRPSLNVRIPEFG